MKSRHPSSYPAAAAIDLGTNTILMVAGRRRSPRPGDIEILDDAHAIARLGQGVDAERRIQPEAIDRVCGCLLRYRDRAAGLGASLIRAYGTSALRDASNKRELIAAVVERTGIEIVELSGEEEARLTFTGAAFGLGLPERYGVVDIGGGSTELALGKGDGTVEQSISVDVGAVRVSERFFPSLPPSPGQVGKAAAMIASVMAGLFEVPSGITVLGVAGTVTTLGALDRETERFDSAELDGHVLARKRVVELSDMLLGLGLEEIQAFPQVSDQRADIITAGSLILRRFLEQFDLPSVIVSTKGIRYGLLQQMLAGESRGRKSPRDVSGGGRSDDPPGWDHLDRLGR